LRDQLETFVEETTQRIRTIESALDQCRRQRDAAESAEDRLSPTAAVEEYEAVPNFESISLGDPSRLEAKSGEDPIARLQNLRAQIEGHLEKVTTDGETTARPSDLKFDGDPQ